MSDVVITYKGATIAELSDTGSKVLNTSGTYCEGDISISYTRPEGGYVVLNQDSEGYVIIPESGEIYAFREAKGVSF